MTRSFGGGRGYYNNVDGDFPIAAMSVGLARNPVEERDEQTTPPSSLASEGMHSQRLIVLQKTCEGSALMHVLTR